MKILGIDPATTTGWVVVDDAGLINCGTIEIPIKYSLGERLVFLSKEIKGLLDIVEPDYIAIEDVIMAVSGVKVLAYLSRLSGVVIKECNEHLGEDVTLYDPPTWKKHSVDGLNGHSKKYEILFAVAKHYDLLTPTQIQTVTESIEFEIGKQNDLKNEIKIIRSKNKKDPNILLKKKQLKILEKTSNISFSEISQDITSITNISEDMADIYQDLRDFTAIYSRGLEEIMNDAAWELKERFIEHWGKKLLRTLTPLHDLFVKEIDPESGDNGTGSQSAGLSDPLEEE